VIKFKRAFFKSEIHSAEYARVRSRCSTHIAIVYLSQNQPVIHYGTVQKFFKVAMNQETYRVAFVTAYIRQTTPNSRSLPKINRNLFYKTQRIINLDTIDSKVIFYGTFADTRVLQVPFHYSKLK